MSLRTLLALSAAETIGSALLVPTDGGALNLVISCGSSTPARNVKIKEGSYTALHVLPD